MRPMEQALADGRARRCGAPVWRVVESSAVVGGPQDRRLHVELTLIAERIVMTLLVGAVAFLLAEVLARLTRRGAP